MIMVGWSNYLADENRAFLMGEFENGEEIYMEVSRGFEEKIGKTVVLKLLQTIYGLQQAARMFWKLLLTAMKSMGFDKSKSDPCLY